MADTPTIAEQPTDESDEGGPTIEDSDADVLDAGEAVEDANEQQGDKTEVNEASVELEEDDFGADNDLFDGVEDSDKQTTDESGDSSTESDSADAEGEGDGLDGIGGLDGNAAALEDAINEGAARLSVVGLTDEDFEDSGMTRDDLETEFSETFAAFRLGYFGSQTIDKYVLQPADGDVNPAWGMAGAVLMATAMVVWMRPDGDDQMAAVRDAVEGIVGGAAA